MLVPATATALAGALLFAWGAGAALRLQIEVTKDDKADKVAAATVANRLYRLGSEPPRGLWVPLQTDVDALPTDTVAELPEGRLAAAALRLARAVLPTVPWRAAISVIDNGRAVMTVTRNRRPIDDVAIDYAALGFPKPADKDDDAALARLYVAVAAVILHRLADRYPELTVGLCGATNWRGTACHVVATEPPIRDDRATSVAILKRSVEIDPMNMLARHALVVVDVDPITASAASERTYAKKLEAMFNDIRTEGRGHEALKVRMLYGQAASLHNAHLFDGATGPDQARPAIENLAALIVAYRAGAKPLREFLDDITPSAGWLWQIIMPSGTDDPHGVRTWSTVSPDSSDSSYQYASYLAEQRPLDIEAVVAALTPAVAVESDREWARYDPSFAELWSEKAFRDVVGTPPPADILALEPFTAHAEKLRMLGLEDPERLYWQTSPTGRTQLMAAVKASDLLVQRWNGIAALYLAVFQSFSQAKDAERETLARVELLFQARIDSQAAIPGDEDGRKVLCDKLVKLGRTSTVCPLPTPATLLRWREAAL